MPIAEDEFELDDQGREWLRIRVFSTGGPMTGFTVQYETTISGKRVAVTRYDTAHGRPHQDILNRRGKVIEKRWLDGLTLVEALELGRRDLLANWRRYRATFLEEQL